MDTDRFGRVSRRELSESALARRERSVARDAALRRITGWTVALALGSAAGTAAVAVAAQAPSRSAAVVDGSGQEVPGGDAPAVDPGTADQGSPATGQDDPGSVAQPGPPLVVSSGS